MPGFFLLAVVATKGSLAEAADSRDQLRMIGRLVVDGAEIAACDCRARRLSLHLKAWPPRPETPLTKRSLADLHRG